MCVCACVSVYVLFAPFFNFNLFLPARYSVDIHEWDAQSKSWVPFQASDVQLEFVRLDPHVRQGKRINKKHCPSNKDTYNTNTSHTHNVSSCITTQRK